MGSGFSINATVMTALQCHLLALKLNRRQKITATAYCFIPAWISLTLSLPLWSLIWKMDLEDRDKNEQVHPLLFPLLLIPESFLSVYPHPHSRVLIFFVNSVIQSETCCCISCSKSFNFTFSHPGCWSSTGLDEEIRGPACFLLLDPRSFTSLDFSPSCSFLLCYTKWNWR